MVVSHQRGTENQVQVPCNSSLFPTLLSLLAISLNSLSLVCPAIYTRVPGFPLEHDQPSRGHTPKKQRKNKNPSPFSNRHQLSIFSQEENGFISPSPPYWVLTGLVLCRKAQLPWAHECFAPVLSRRPCLTGFPFDLWCLQYFWSFPISVPGTLPKDANSDVLFMAEHPTNSCFLHFDQLWVVDRGYPEEPPNNTDHYDNLSSQFATDENHLNMLSHLRTGLDCFDQSGKSHPDCRPPSGSIPDKKQMAEGWWAYLLLAWPAILPLS